MNLQQSQGVSADAPGPASFPSSCDCASQTACINLHKRSSNPFRGVLIFLLRMVLLEDKFVLLLCSSFASILAYKIPKEDVQSLSHSFSKLEEGNGAPEYITNSFVPYN